MTTSKPTSLTQSLYQVSLFLGGIVLIFIEYKKVVQIRIDLVEVEDLSYKNAFLSAFSSCLSWCPGTSWAAANDHWRVF